MRRLLPLISLLVPALHSAGCGPAIAADFRSPEPAARNAAIVEAAATGDRSALPGLVTMLDADDPATRLLAIDALRRITGETLGYDHAAEPLQRKAAIGRWVERVGRERPAAFGPLGARVAADDHPPGGPPR